MPSALQATIEIHDAGLTLAKRYGLSTYDGMIVAAALQAGCDTLLSQDMQHGMLIGGLQIVNLFQVLILPVQRGRMC